MNVELFAFFVSMAKNIKFKIMFKLLIYTKKQQRYRVATENTPMKNNNYINTLMHILYTNLIKPNHGNYVHSGPCLISKLRRFCDL